ncbi:MAG: penicillin acylase family protein [Acidobacteriota bacterium]
MKRNRLVRIGASIGVAVLAALTLLERGGGSQDSPLREEARQVLARTAGTMKLRGLEKPVTVIRDEWGIPHIYAETQADLFFAQGFVAAQDRLWQMDLWRRVGEGRLAEVVGKGAVERDRFARLLRYRGDMEAEWKSYAPDARPIIESFVAGVNAWIAETGDRLPIEFRLAGYRPEAWTPEVCLTRMAGYVMTRNAPMEVLRAQLAHQYGVKFVDEWIEADPPRRLEIPPGLDLAGIEPRILAAANAAGGPVSFNPSDGSNNWVVDGSMTASGKPLLANDPHRTIALPSLRYLVHLVGPGWNVIGAGEPTLPGVAAGHNERVAFGFTIVGIDQQDIYVEELNPANPNEYRYRGRWEKMRIEREQIRVKGEAQPREVELKFTIHGPVIHEEAGRHRAYALRWVGSEPGTAGYLASLTLNRVRNWPEFLKAMERWKVPSENLIYADVEGNIGWVAAGLTPIRRNWSGMIPVPGASGEYEWEGFLPVSELPQSFNPARHYIATANHNILPQGYTKQLGYEWANPIRYQRIDEVLRRPGVKYTVADFERLQHDEMSLPARQLIEVLKASRIEDPELQPYLRLLREWDGQLGRDSGAAALFEIWLTRLPEAVFRRRVSAEQWSQIASRLPIERVIAALKGGQETAAIAQSLTAAVSEARRRLGDDVSLWRWGRLHRAPFNHPLANEEARRELLNLPDIERGGDGNTVNNTSGANFRQTHGASFREILDVSDWDRSVATNAPGQSGQPGSRHYDDLLKLWAKGQYFPLLYSRQRVEASAKQRLLLQPGRQ